MSAPPVDAPRIRIRRPPALDPPYDDERHPDAWIAAAQSPLELTAPAAEPAPPIDRSVRATAGSSPPARQAAGQFLRVFLEVLSGYRPAAHLRKVSDPLAAAGVVQASTDAARRMNRARRRGDAARDRRLGASAVRVCEPRAGVAELSAVLSQGSRAWAMVARLEQQRGRWLCTTARVL